PWSSSKWAWEGWRPCTCRRARNRDEGRPVAARERWDASGPGYRCCGGRREIVAEAHPAPAGPLAGTRFVSFENIVASGPSPSIHPSLEGLLGANGEGRPGANAGEGGRLRIR